MKKTGPNSKNQPDPKKQKETFKETKSLLKLASTLLKKNKKKLDEKTVQEIKPILERLSAELKAKEIDQVEKTLPKLKTAFEQHLLKYKKSKLREILEGFIVPLLIVLALRAFVIESFKIPTGSMIPSLKIGDHLFVTKFDYGFMIPFTNVKFLEFKQPKRGEIIVFRYPLDLSKDFIKRVIGIGGDKIEIKNRLIYINDKPIFQKALGEKRYWDKMGADSDLLDNLKSRIDRINQLSDEERLTLKLMIRGFLEQLDFTEKELAAWKEKIESLEQLSTEARQKIRNTLIERLQWHEWKCVVYQEKIEGNEYTAIYHKSEKVRNFGPYTVKPGHVFVMGDNRDNSHDCRFWYPPGTEGSLEWNPPKETVQVPLNLIKGKALIIWHSYNEKEGWMYGRMFKIIR